MKSSANNSSKTSEFPLPWTSSVFRRTTAFAASDIVAVLIWLTRWNRYFDNEAGSCTRWLKDPCNVVAGDWRSRLKHLMREPQDVARRLNETPCDSLGKSKTESIFLCSRSSKKTHADSTAGQLRPLGRSVLVRVRWGRRLGFLLIGGWAG